MSIISKIISKLAEKQIEQAYKQGYHSAYKEHVTDREQNTQEYYLRLYNESLKGRKIIYCPNEWCDPIFAIITGAGRYYTSGQVMVEARDVLAQETTLLNPNSFYIADELMTKTILKLNPFERWNMGVGRLSHMSNIWSKGYGYGNITSNEKLEMQLRECGFLFKSKSAFWWLENMYDQSREYFSKRLNINYKFKQIPESSSYMVYIHLKEDHIHSFVLEDEEQLTEFKNIVGLYEQKT